MSLLVEKRVCSDYGKIRCSCQFGVCAWGDASCLVWWFSTCMRCCIVHLSLARNLTVHGGLACLSIMHGSCHAFVTLPSLCLSKKKKSKDQGHSRGLNHCEKGVSVSWFMRPV